MAGRRATPTRRAALLSAFALALCGVGPALALEWPVLNAVVTGTFGEDRGDHFHGGIDIGGEDQEVHPVLPGELVFRYDEGADYSSLPRGTGSMVVLRHSQNILSLYCHLAKGSIGAPLARYAPANRIGLTGDTGHSDGKHLHFAVYDAEAAAFLNPLSFLPPVADRQTPVIRRVLFVSGDRRQPVQNGAIVKPGKAEVLVECGDLREDVRFSWLLAPYSVSLSLDGAQASRILFDTLAVKDGRTVLGGTGMTRDAVYGPDGSIRCGTLDLSGGDSRLRISVRDFAGNEVTREIGFTVRD
jgi:hypothetical protein